MMWEVLQNTKICLQDFQIRDTDQSMAMIQTVKVRQVILSAAILLALVALRGTAFSDSLDSKKSKEFRATRLGCGFGFGGWETPPKPRSEEIDCDMQNISRFSKSLLKCKNAISAQALNYEIGLYDINKDQCATCDDFFLWKERISKGHELAERTTDGSQLRVAGCVEGAARNAE